MEIRQNHPFVDGNKRTAAVAAIVFLSLKGMELDANETQPDNLVLDVTRGEAGPHSLVVDNIRGSG